ncbi:MAG: peptidase family protein [Gemmatimonadetes bacterium]|jgi:Zn-dependent protease with chaperone function|nr:peptidase family protein [Gemmatimonadota bacterium]
MPTPLPQISSRAWEHPADRAALNTLRAIPGFDEIVRQVATFLTERRVRQIFLANAVQVNPVQRPKLDALLTDVCTTLDWPKRPELYVTQTQEVNAYAIGYEDPFIVMTSGALELLESDDERRFLLAHELGHIMSDHMTLRTIAMVILSIGSLALMPIGLALLPFQLGLLEWHRKSELSSDRAALLALQDKVVAQRTFMRLAGGRDYGDTTSVDAFMTQAATYETTGDTWDKILKVFNTAFREHPFHTVRAAELERWRTSGEYDAIIAGAYTRRGEKGQGLGDDFSDAARYYSGKANAGMSSVGDALDRAKSAFNDAFRGREEPPVPPSEPNV